MKKNNLLNENTKRLFAYSSAAGLGAFAADRSADAALIRGSETGFDPITLEATGGYFNQSFFLDIDNDLLNEFQIRLYSNTADTSDAVQIDSINTGASVQILTPFGSSYNSGISTNPVGAFVEGSLIGNSLPTVNLSGYPIPWAASRDAMTTYNDFSGERKYLGVRGSSGSYAWVRMDINMDTLGSPSVTVSDYGFEDNVGMSLVVPEPSTLGLLAIGALGIALRRKAS